MDELRARYHFQPEKNWMNDPNGPVVIDGKLHLFYLRTTPLARSGAT